MNITEEQAKAMVGRQNPDQRAAMLACARQHAPNLTSLRLEAWLAKDSEPLSDDNAHFVNDWCLNRFGYTGNSDGYVKANIRTGPAVIVGVKPEAFHGDEKLRKFIAGQPAGAVRNMPAKNRGRDLPSPDEAKIAAARKREEAEDLARATNAPTLAKAKAAIQPLMNFGALHKG